MLRATKLPEYDHWFHTGIEAPVITTTAVQNILTHFSKRADNPMMIEAGFAGQRTTLQ